MAWGTAGPLTNPTAGAVLADTGNLPLQGLAPQVFVSATVQCAVIAEHRDATNTVTKMSHIFPVNASAPFEMDWKFPFDIGEGERFRLSLNAAVTGRVQGSITY